MKHPPDKARTTHARKTHRRTVRTKQTHRRTAHTEKSYRRTDKKTNRQTDKKRKRTLKTNTTTRQDEISREIDRGRPPGKTTQPASPQGGDTTTTRQTRRSHHQQGETANQNRKTLRRMLAKCKQQRRSKQACKTALKQIFKAVSTHHDKHAAHDDA